jgi:glycosyltransferase involved in cell wall biosynthesis
MSSMGVKLGFLTYSTTVRLGRWIEKTKPGLPSWVRQVWRRYSDRIIYNVFGESAKGKHRALLSYLPYAFYLNPDSLLSLAHENIWKCREIGMILRDSRFVVDVASCVSAAFTPKHRYDLFFEVGHNLDRIGHLLPDACIKIVSSTGNHWLFQNRAELERLAGVKERRGVVLKPRRLAPPTFADLTADALIMVGNEFTKGTYSHVTCPVYQVRNPALGVPHISERPWSRAHREFLWLGGAGAVLKGLDLVLEVFARMPDLHLHVVGDIESEPDFFEAYRKELLKTMNITYHGYVHHVTDAFLEIARSCCAVVYPSASDANPGSVLSCMSNGLIPIVSYEAGLDVGEAGVILRDCSLDTIQAEVARMADLGEHELRERSASIIDRIARFHSRSSYSMSMRKALGVICSQANFPCLAGES